MKDNTLNLQVLIGAHVPITSVLMEMTRLGSSVLLNWGEDDNLWECSWITGGKRYTAFDLILDSAVRQCVQEALKSLKSEAAL